MKKQFLSDLSVGDTVDSMFAAKDKRLLDSRSKPGQQYLSVRLRDRDGEVEGRAWENGPSLASRFESGDVIAVEGTVVEWQKARQINITTLKRVPLPDIDLEDFVARTTRNVEELVATIQRAIDSLSDRHLRELLNLFYREEVFLNAFKRAPAAKTLHHAFLGGLAEHFCSLLALAEALCANCASLNRDLVITGVLLHDIGKLHELRTGLLFDYTDVGRLYGHIYIGAQMAADRIREVEGFPPELGVKVIHMILSHHGTRAFGAVALPATAEAVALHLLDNMDAQVNQVLRLIDEAGVAAAWTEYNRLHERHFFTGNQPLKFE